MTKQRVLEKVLLLKAGSLAASDFSFEQKVYHHKFEFVEKILNFQC